MVVIQALDFFEKVLHVEVSEFWEGVSPEIRVKLNQFGVPVGTIWCPQVKETLRYLAMTNCHTNLNLCPPRGSVFQPDDIPHPL